MGMSSTGVLIYAMPSLQRYMPCIFVIYVVTSTSMQTRLRDVSVFRDEFVNEEPVEYAYEDQAFDNSENLAGKMTIPSKSLLSLLC